MRLLLRWLVSAAAAGAAAYFVPGIEAPGGVPALLAFVLILGLVNGLVRPIVRRLACGAIALTLGLFIFVINALMLLLAAWITRTVGFGIEVDGFLPALLGAIVISVVSFLLSFFLPDRKRKRRR